MCCATVTFLNSFLFLLAGLIPLLVRLLYPKMRKRSGRLGGKGAPGSARAAILNYLAALEPSELAPLVHLFLQPVSAVFKLQDSAGASLETANVSKDRYADWKFTMMSSKVLCNIASQVQMVIVLIIQQLFVQSS